MRFCSGVWGALNIENTHRCMGGLHVLNRELIGSFGKNVTKYVSHLFLSIQENKHRLRKQRYKTVGGVSFKAEGAVLTSKWNKCCKRAEQHKRNNGYT